MNLSHLKPPAGQKKARSASATAWAPAAARPPARGTKGARRLRLQRMRGFEGGQMPLHRRLPKRGFTNIFKKQYAIVNLGRLEKLEGDTFDPDTPAGAGSDPQTGGRPENSWHRRVDAQRSR